MSMTVCLVFVKRQGICEAPITECPPSILMHGIKRDVDLEHVEEIADACRYESSMGL